MAIEFSVQLVNEAKTVLSVSSYSMFFFSDQISTTSDGNLYAYFLSNVQTANHTSAMFGIRELNQTELTAYCPNNSSVGTSTVPVTDRLLNFTANYRIRVYTSGCYYLDTDSNWRSDGVVVR
jgi:hypothetical protein